jgi:hypothetical protein
MESTAWYRSGQQPGNWSELGSVVGVIRRVQIKDTQKQSVALGSFLTAVKVLRQKKVCAKTCLRRKGESAVPEVLLASVI